MYLEVYLNISLTADFQTNALTLYFDKSWHANVKKKKKRQWESWFLKIEKLQLRINVFIWYTIYQ